MKKALKVIGIGIIIFTIGGLGGFLVDYIIFTKVITHPVWSQNSFIKAIDNRIKVVKTVEKVIVADNESIADIASRVAGTVVYVESVNQDGTVTTGNGMILSGDGVIVTDANIVAKEDSMFSFVRLASGEVHDVKDSYFDEYRDLVFLRIDAHDLATASFANSDDARSGKRLISISRSKFGEAKFALGGFFGRDYEFSVNNPMSDFLQGVLEIDFSQSVLDQSIGSPVVDFHGNAVGLVSVKQNIESGENEFYALASNDVYEAYEEFLLNQDLEKGIPDSALGVDYKVITALDAYANEYEISNGIIVVQPETYKDQSVFANTKAAKNGIEGGDIIVMVNNESIDEKNNLSRLLKKYEDEKLTLKVLRDGKLISIKIDS